MHCIACEASGACTVSGKEVASVLYCSSLSFLLQPIGIYSALLCARAHSALGNSTRFSSLRSRRKRGLLLGMHIQSPYTIYVNQFIFIARAARIIVHMYQLSTQQVLGLLGIRRFRIRLAVSTLTVFFHIMIFSDSHTYVL